ncbi:PREDICTED: serine/arginine repetitive matrix protein 1-like [Priapulus caudatus]|uniref:Serine/arginine repetitive matrix protein 1-like n=1 Tax=Priapulus caudatus TaxID=37621 RepID=A0ABM1EP96_PRICU|nr:PREDICTED: serine/arginine repetitive matrix protein 1-like [Priapulus caudatus]
MIHDVVLSLLECVRKASTRPGCAGELPRVANATRTCDHVTGVCNLHGGLARADAADLPCPDFFYGYHCRHQCECEHGASCDPVRGECMCTAGWHGNTCQLSCDEGTYGIGCTQPCDCINTDVCDPIDGTCICIGATGPNCTDRCEPLYYGNNCSEPCICQPDHSASCDPVIGKCVCTYPWSGSNCTECVRGRYGQECELICNCGSVSCDGFTGECICPSGTQGPDCNATCLSGFWGKQCRGRCAERCVHASTCHHVSGECACAPGWMGETCEQGCDVGRYGAGCVHECQCENEGSCDSATGACNCSISWSGQRCEIFAMAERDADPDEQKGALPIAVACVIGAAAIVVVILIVMVVYRRRKAAVTKQKNGDIELRNISSAASQNAPNGHAPPGPSGELPSKRRRRNRKASVEPGYKYNNPNYEQHVGSVSSSSTRPHRANSAPHRMNRGSASTTGTGNVSMSGNPIYYHSSSGSRVSDSDTDSTEHTPLTTAPPGTVIFNPLAEMSDGSPARPPDNTAHPLPPLPSNAYEYVSPPVDNRLPTLSADRPSPRPAPPPPPLEAEEREEEEEDDEGMYSVVGEWRGIVSDDPPLPPAEEEEEEEEEEDGVVYADIEDVPARAWNGDAAIEGATSGDEYDTLDLTTRQKRSVVSSGALSTASPPNIYGRLSGPGGGGSGHWSEASSQRRPSSNTSEKPEQTYEYIDPNDVKLPTKPPASPKKLPRPQKLPRSKKPSGDSDKGGAGSLPRPTPQARTYVKCPISPELPPRPRALLRAPPVDTSNRESNIYAEIPEGIIGVGLHDGTRSGDSDVTPASVDNRLSHISSGTSSVNPGDRLSQLSSGSSSVNPGDRLSQLSSGSSSVNSGDRLSQISSSSSSVNPGHRSSRSGSLSPHPPAFTESQLTGKWPPPRLPEKQGGRALSAASREEIGEEEEEEGEAPVLYDVPRTASVHSAGEQRETSDEDSRLQHSAPASAASTHLDDIPETPCSDGGATASKPHDEATLAYGGATADAFDDSVGIYANSQASASGQLYDVPRTQRHGGRANVTHM